MNSVRVLQKILYILTMVVIIAACSGPVATKKTPFRIAYTKWWGDYTVIIADKKGFFTKHGVEVKPVYYDVFSKALPDLASGQLDGGTFTIGDTLNINSHTNLTAVGMSDDGGANVIVGQPGITNISDLRGKSIGVIIGSAHELIIENMLASAGLNTNDVNYVDVDPENVLKEIKKNNIQAGLTWEPYSTAAISAGYPMLYTSDQFAGLFGDVIVFRRDVVLERPEDIRNYLKAWYEAVDFRRKNPAESNQLIAFALNIPPEEVQGDARLFTLSEAQAMYAQSIDKNANSIYKLAQINADYMIRNGILTKIPPIDQLFDPAYLDK